MIRFGLSADGKQFNAAHFGGYGDGLESQPISNPDHRLAVVLDTETTGIDRQNDEIIELAMRQFCFDRKTGEIVWIGSQYSALAQPSAPLSDEVKNVTGLTDEELAGKQIDWQAAEQLVAPAAVIIAHNAAFDRQFIERYMNAPKEKIWADSFTQINWDAFPVSKQPILCLLHGFFYDGHRALNDIDALLKLLAMPSNTMQNSSYLFEMLQNAKTPQAAIRAVGAPFEGKDKLKARGYRWIEKTWMKKIPAEQIDSERAWLKEAVYGDQLFTAETEKIALKDNFKTDL